MKFFIIILFIIVLVNGCSYSSNIKIQENNISTLSLKEQEYVKYKNDFFYNGTYENITIKYFKGSYSEGQASSFEPSVPSELMTQSDIEEYNTYFKVIYTNGKQVEGIGVTDGKVDTTFYYDIKGRIVKKYYHRNDTFYLKKYNGEESLDEVYCNEGRFCEKRHLKRSEDEKEYEEPTPVFMGL